MTAGTPGEPGHSHIPAWRRRTEGEQRWWVVSALVVAIVLEALMPSRFTLHPRYLVAAIAGVWLVVLIVSNPDRMSRRSPAVRRASIVLLVLITVANAISVGLLIHAIVSGHSIAARQLLVGGAEIWVTNVIIFSQVYWEYDRGGPAARAAGENAAGANTAGANTAGQSGVPDLLFPQMTDDALGRDWEPNYLDYLFVSYTNSTAFSPTDTMPLSRWCKVLFMAQSAVSLVTVGLVAARAVNILPGN